MTEAGEGTSLSLHTEGGGAGWGMRRAGCSTLGPFWMRIVQQLVHVGACAMLFLGIWPQEVATKDPIVTIGHRVAGEACNAPIPGWDTLLPQAPPRQGTFIHMLSSPAHGHAHSLWGSMHSWTRGPTGHSTHGLAPNTESVTAENCCS